MPQLIHAPVRIEAQGNLPKVIEEFFGRVNTQTDAVSIARMQSPAGWQEPGQEPDFTEYTVVVRGVLRVEYGGGVFDVKAGQAVVAQAGEWVRYSTPFDEGAEYIAICLPAFAPDLANRD